MQPLISAGVAAGIEHKRLLANLNCKHVFDIGANRGQFALVARQCFPNARIDSFEPLNSPAKKFNSAFTNDKNVYLHEVAIGPEAITTKINVSAKDDSSSLLPISDLQNQIFPGTEKADTKDIKVAPLRYYIKAEDIILPALLKIDVQGYELQTLKGCEELLDKFQYIYIECSFVELYEGQALAHDILLYLSKHGFILNGIYNMSYDKKGIAIQADFFFIDGNA